MQEKKFKALIVFVILLWILIFFIFKLKTYEKTPYYDQQIKAYEIMEKSSAKIIEYKKAEGIEISKDDTLKTGLIGDEFSKITTTLGSLSAKRTAAIPDMAAMLVKMYHQIGLDANQKVAIATSGSFPGLNLAAICAAESMNLDTVIISSVGSSTYGANQEKMSFPKILNLLNKDGILKSNSRLITPGGDDDVGNNIEKQILKEIFKYFETEKPEIMIEPDFTKNIKKRIAVFNENKPPDAFVAVGGNLSFLGLSDQSLLNSQGILKKPKNLLPFDDDKGLINYYLNKNTPVIYLLNVKKIVSDYNLPYDPTELPRKGTSAVFYEEKYDMNLIYIGLILAFAAFLYILRKEK